MSNKLRPNFLVVMPDQYRSDFIGSMGSMPVRTPHIDAIASNGVTFTNATTPCPLCAPARACLASGSSYEDCGVSDNSDNFDVARETFYSRLSASGYEVATCGKLDLQKATKFWGRNGDHKLSELGFTRGFDSEGKLDAVKAYSNNGFSPAGPYMQFLEDHGLARTHYEDFSHRDRWLDTYPTPLPDFAYCDNWIADHACRLLSGFESDTPWFLVVNFAGPHNPQDITAGMEQRVRGRDFPPAVENTSVAPDRLNAIRQNYAAMSENIDTHLGKLVEVLEARGEVGNTVVVFLSDHGEMLGDHDLWGKRVWYNPSLRIPFIMSAPDGIRGEKSDALIQFQDLASTVMDYAGIAHGDFQNSRSIRSLVQDDSHRFRDAAVSGMGEWRMAFDGRYKLVVTEGGEHSLYDVIQDPDELHDILPSHRQDAMRLLRNLPAAFRNRISLK